MNTGVIGGDADLDQSPAPKISDSTSSSQPCFTPSMAWHAKKGPLIGVCNTSQLIGGLLAVLSVEERGGVDGANRRSEQFVSIGKRYGESC